MWHVPEQTSAKVSVLWRRASIMTIIIMRNIEICSGEPLFVHLCVDMSSPSTAFSAKTDARIMSF
jgi:hypothetical protein